MLRSLPESYITHYGWSAAILQYAAPVLLGDVAPYAQHAEGTVYIKGLEKNMKLWGATSLSIVPILEGRTISALLAKLEDENPVHYRLHQLSVDPALATSWLDALAYASGAQSSNVPVDGVRKIVPQSFLAVLPRHPYIMVV
jgi:hypothetical protein